MTTTNAGWTIKYEVSEAALGDLSGYDAEQSMRRYRDLLEQTLREQFPGAEIDVTLADFYNGCKVEVYGPNANYAPHGADDEAQDLLNLVEEVANKVFVNRAQEWAVEA